MAVREAAVRSDSVRRPRPTHAAPDGLRFSKLVGSRFGRGGESRAASCADALSAALGSVRSLPMARPTLVVLGASGDLAARLIFPALLSLEYRERLEDLRIIGCARQEWTNEQFHENLRAAMATRR